MIIVNIIWWCRLNGVFTGIRYFESLQKIPCTLVTCLLFSAAPNHHEANPSTNPSPLWLQTVNVKKKNLCHWKGKETLTLTTIEREQNCSTWLQMFNVHGQTFLYLYITKVILEFTLDNIGTKSMRRIYYECRNFLKIRGVSYKCLRLSGMRDKISFGTLCFLWNDYPV